MGASGLAEVVLWARQMERSLAFYRDLLGLEQISPPELPTHFLRAGSAGDGVPSMVVLVPHPDPDSEFPPAKASRPLHHLALSVPAGEWEALLERCRSAHLEVRAGAHPVLQAVRTAYIDDPDGNEVELISPLPPA